MPALVTEPTVPTHLEEFPDPPMTLSRRRFLDWSLRHTALLALLGQWSPPLSAQGSGDYRLVDVLPFLGEGRNHIGRLSGSGLDGRRAYDTSRLTSRRLVTPTEEFFVRTRAPEGLAERQPWRIRVDGLVEKPGNLDVEPLARRATDLGTHLVECAGSTSNSYYGLMSAASWSGVPLAGLLEPFTPSSNATQVVVTGVDPETGPNPGASWVFPLADLERLGLALATGMNGGPLPADHGGPVRLMVPGWYGCCWIKWVESITFVDDGFAATDQMVEYAGRTHQRGLPRRARDFAPAAIDPAAMPVRVEHWESASKGTFYRVIGIAWGGERPNDSLEIRTGDAGPFERVPVAATSATTWTLWSHLWHPKTPGRYTFRLRYADTTLQTRRLDGGFYRRAVEVREV